MKYKVTIAVCAIAFITACQDRSAEQDYTENDTVTATNNEKLPDSSIYNDEHIPDTVDIFSGERFRNVRVEKIGDSTFELTGEAQVFEAAFSWVIEDGHNELQKGHIMKIQSLIAQTIFYNLALRLYKMKRDKFQ